MVPFPPVVRCIALIIDELSELGDISWSSAELGFLGEVAKSDASKTLTWSNPTAMLFVSAGNRPHLPIFAIFLDEGDAQGLITARGPEEVLVMSALRKEHLVEEGWWGEVGSKKESERGGAQYLIRKNIAFPLKKDQKQLIQ